MTLRDVTRDVTLDTRDWYLTPSGVAFVKLDCGLLDSTLWLDRQARELFITALLMAEPYELRLPEAQIEVTELKETGFVIPAGWYGLVRAAGPGIIRRAGMEDDIGTAALHRLGQPDMGSRTPDFEGRRLVRINGGYVVLNFAKYREKDHTAAERSKRYRASKRKLRAKGKGPLSGEASTLAKLNSGEISQEHADNIAANTREKK